MVINFNGLNRDGPLILTEAILFSSIIDLKQQLGRSGLDITGSSVILNFF